MKPLILFVSAVVLCLPASGDTITLTPSADTTIADGAVSSADGSSDRFITGRTAAGVPARGLLRFNFGDIPEGAVVTSVTLTVNVAKSHNGNLELHDLHRLLADWTENGATWNSSGLAPWTGGDFSANSDSTTALGSSGPFTFPSSPALVSTVQMWLTNGGTNFGWLLHHRTEEPAGNALRIYTGNSGTPPSLVVDYTPPPPPPPTIGIANPRIADGKFIFDFVAEGGFSYVAQYKEALQPGAWTDFAWFPDPGVSTPITVEDPLTTTNRFYRVIVP